MPNQNAPNNTDIGANTISSAISSIAASAPKTVSAYYTARARTEASRAVVGGTANIADIASGYSRPFNLTIPLLIGAGLLLFLLFRNRQ